MGKRDGRGQKYAPPSAAMRKYVEETRNAKNRTVTTIPEGMDQFKIEKPGTYCFDVIPFVAKRKYPGYDPGMLVPFCIYHVHFDVGPNKRAVLCPRTVNKPCPICDEERKLKGNPNISKDELKLYWPKKRMMMFVVDVNDRETGVQLFDMPYHNFG